jgi:hypothetical protein
MSETQVKKPIYKRWWFWVIIVIVAGAIIGWTSAGVGGGEDDGNGNGNGGNGNGNGGNGNGNGGGPTTNYYLGDKVTSGSIEFTAVSVDNKTLLGTEWVGESTENNFVIVEVKIKNVGNSEVRLIASYFELSKSTSTYEVHSGSIYLDNGFFLGETIGSGISKTIVIAFETPTTSTAEEYKLTVKGGALSTKQSIIVKNKPA